MSGLFPEQPVLFYPSLARRFGTDEALLLSVYQQSIAHHGSVDADGLQGVTVRRRDWLAMADFWDEDRLARATHSLIDQGVIAVEFLSNGSLRIAMESNPPAHSTDAISGQSLPQETGRQPQPLADKRDVAPESVKAAQKNPVRDGTLSTRPTPLAASVSAVKTASTGSSFAQPVTTSSDSMMARGPAPCFGGSTGWKRPKDDLERLFEQREVRNRQLQPMQAQWQPGDTAWQLLDKQNIPRAFAEDCVDEFVAYWLERDRKESSWDHLFIRLVKKEWVKAQGRRARDARMSDDTTTEANGERHQADSRAQRRERITDAVMDIHNTDW